MGVKPLENERQQNRLVQGDVNFNLKLEMAPSFMGKARPFQKAMHLRRALDEMQDDLIHLDRYSRSFVSGSSREKFEGEVAKLDPDAFDKDTLVIGGHQVMMAWETPMMHAMAEAVTFRGGDILEVGFGLGISGTKVMHELYHSATGGSYTIIEPNPTVLVALDAWKERMAAELSTPAPIHVLVGYWENVVDGIEKKFDGILFDPYEKNYELMEKDDNGRSFEHMIEFFPKAAALLRPGGALTWFSGEIETLGRSHQREILKHFSSFNVQVVRGMQPPDDCQYWWNDSMVVVTAYK